MSDTLPTPKDPTAIAIETTTEEAAVTARHYLDTLLGASLEQGGGMIFDTVGYWRFKNRINLVLKAKQFLESKGIEPTAVLPKVALPILEAGSLETDDAMQDKWASLLAHAATPDVGERVLPGYADILRQLTPIQARIVDWLYDLRQEVAPDEFLWPEVERFNIQKQFSLSNSDYALLMSDLRRLQVIDGKRRVAFKHHVGMFDTSGSTWTTQSMYGTITLTALGVHFVEACRA